MTIRVWTITVRHDGLKRIRTIKGRDQFIVAQKATAQKAIWDELWKRKVRFNRKEEMKNLSIEQTREVQAMLEAGQKILQSSLAKSNQIDWGSLKDNSKFAIEMPAPKEAIVALVEPFATETKFRPQYGFLNFFIPSWKEARREEARERFQVAHKNWEIEQKKIDQQNVVAQEEHRQKVLDWEKEKEAFYQTQAEFNLKVDTLKNVYPQGDNAAVNFYCENVLERSEYPDYIPKHFYLDYTPESKVLVIDYYLPNTEEIPKTKEIKFVAARDELVEVPLSETEAHRFYDNLLYQITLRTVHEIFDADRRELVDAVVFNGCVESIDKGTGKQIGACILSLQASRKEFTEINLAQVDPKVCFRNLKGVGSSQLHSMAPVAPIISLNRDDKRFVPAHTVVAGIDESSNLAAMDWEEFEHLIRELFAKEFAQSGGEVKVTRASRDFGVDAIAFDPDPIRGGKIVIQAKRYTNTVDVSAVRDLFGTVMNEGATKGILVTTSHYGPEAYEFAKGKPITLLDGGHLLHLLQKHGHKAHIDLKEAKKQLAEMRDERAKA